MFQGASSIGLDSKGRLAVPTRHRDVLSATAASLLTITKHPHGCLMIFPRNEWEKFRDRIVALPMQPSARIRSPRVIITPSHAATGGGAVGSR